MPGRRGGRRWPGRGAARVLCGHRAQKPLQLGLREAGAQDPVGALAGMGGGVGGEQGSATPALVDMLGTAPPGWRGHVIQFRPL